MAPKDLSEYVRWVLDQNPDNTALDSEVRQQLEKDYEKAVERQINAAIVGALPQRDLPTFEQLIESGTQAEIQKYCESKIPHMDDLVASVLTRFKVDYLGY